jgi:hypothetical protein
VKIQRRTSKKTYLKGKNIYAYGRTLLEVPRKLRETMIPFFDEDLEVDVNVQNGRLTITYTSSKEIK